MDQKWFPTAAGAGAGGSREPGRPCVLETGEELRAAPRSHVSKCAVRDTGNVMTSVGGHRLGNVILSFLVLLTSTQKKSLPFLKNITF